MTPRRITEEQTAQARAAIARNDGSVAKAARDLGLSWKGTKGRAYPGYYRALVRLEPPPPHWIAELEKHPEDDLEIAPWLFDSGLAR